MYARRIKKSFTGGKYSLNHATSTHNFRNYSEVPNTVCYYLALKSFGNLTVGNMLIVTEGI